MFAMRFLSIYNDTVLDVRNQACWLPFLMASRVFFNVKELMF